MSGPVRVVSSLLANFTPHPQVLLILVGLADGILTVIISDQDFPVPVRLRGQGLAKCLQMIK